MATAAFNHSRTQAKVLSVLRSLLRYARDDLTVTDGMVPPARDTKHFQRHIMNEYRTYQHVTSKSEVKALRMRAADSLGLVEAVRHQQELFNRYKGVDADAPEQRKAVARFVGLEVPEAVPLGRDATAVTAAYSSRIATAASAAQLEELKGIDNIKAQYYGIEAVRPGVAAAKGSGGAGGGSGAAGAAAPLAAPLQ